MGILNGQPVSAEITNPAFINKNIDDVMPNILGFSHALSGPSIADIQAAVNKLFTATGASEASDGTDYGAPPNTINNGDSYQTALTKLANKFSGATGHHHTGADGDGPVLSVVLSARAFGFPALIGDIIFQGMPGVQVTQAGQTISIAATGHVDSIAASGALSGIGGNVIIAGGPGAQVSQAGQVITVSATGHVDTLNGLNGNVLIAGGSNINISTVGQTITIAVTGASSTLQQAYNNSTQPQIVLSAAQGTLKVNDNSTPLGTDLFSVNNFGSTTSFFRVSASGANVNGFLGINNSAATHTLDALIPADNNLFIDGRTNPRTITEGTLTINQTAGISSTRAINLDVNSAGFADTSGMSLNWNSGPLSVPSQNNAIQVSVNGSSSTNGVVNGLDVETPALGGLLSVNAMRAGPNVNPISQLTGPFVNSDQSWYFNGSTFTSTVTGTHTIFINNGDILYIGKTASTFSSSVVVISTGANRTITPIFEYWNGSAWTTFIPTDGTNGFTQTGNISFTASNLTGWASTTVNAAAAFYIRITRTKPTLTANPVETAIQINTGSLFRWTNTGDIIANSINLLGSSIATSHIDGITITPTAGGTTTLANNSTKQQVFTGTLNQTLVLPSTLVVAGQQFIITNSSTGVITVLSSGLNTIQAISPNGSLTVTALVNAPTTAANWNVQTGSGSGLAQSPTVTKIIAPGAGSYTSPANVAYLRVRLVGAGGGGSGSGTASSSSDGTAGTGSFFRIGASPDLLVASGGGNATFGASSGGNGGTATISSPAIGTAFVGGAGNGAGYGSANGYGYGGNGGATIFGGAGRSGGYGATGGNGAPNTGAGGGGAGATGTAAGYGGAGGGSGGAVEAIIVPPTPGQVYSYNIGLHGNGGAGGTGGGLTSGNGADGYLEITEFYPNISVSSTLVGISPTVSRATTAGSGAGTGGFSGGTNYVVPAGVQWISIKMVGGGGGGGGASTAAAANPSVGIAGGNTTFGTCTAGGGGASITVVGVSPGGLATLGAGFTGTAISGGDGVSGGNIAVTTSSVSGCAGGSSALGGAGAGDPVGGGGAVAGKTNTGGGGGAGHPTTPANSYYGSGGAAGAFIQAIFVPTAGQVIPFSVGAGGAGGTTGNTGGTAGAAGGSGYIEIFESYSNLAVGTQAAIPANQFMSGPANGAAAQPNFRTLVVSDLPNPRSYIRLNTSNGWGSTSTKIRRFTNIISNVGSDITYADSATLGASFTINTAGLYSISYSDNSSVGSVQLAIILNDNQGTLSPFSTTPANILAGAVTGGASLNNNISVSMFLNIGDIIRAKGEGLATDTAQSWGILFSIAKVNT